MLSVVTLNVVLLNVIMLNVVAPSQVGSSLSLKHLTLMYSTKTLLVYYNLLNILCLQESLYETLVDPNVIEIGLIILSVTNTLAYRSKVQVADN
jgi:hypothetical protein